MFLYKRWIGVTVSDCLVGTTAAVAAEVGLASDAVAGDLDTTNFTIELTLTDKLDRETGSVSVVDDDGVAIGGVIASAAAAPTYTFALNSVSSAFGKYTASGASYVVLA